MLNVHANQKLRQLGCKWNGSEWVAPDVSQVEAQQVKDDFFNNLFTIEVTVLDRCLIKHERMGYTQFRTIAGYTIAAAKHRDHGASICNGVAFVKGGAGSGGSMKNYICTIEEGSIIRMKAGKGAIPYLDEEVASGAITYTVIESESRESLIAQKEELLKRLQEIEEKLKG
jgi:hypothetical protein